MSHSRHAALSLDSPLFLGTIHRADPEADTEHMRGDEDSTGPALQFDYEAVANRLFELASGQSTPSQNRKRLYKVIRKLQELAGGTFPEDDIPEKAYKKLLEGRRERKKKKKKHLLKLQPRRDRGSEAEALSPDLNPGTERKRKRPGRRGAPEKRGPRPRPGARVRGATIQQPAGKKKWPPQGSK